MTTEDKMLLPSFSGALLVPVLPVLWPARNPQIILVQVQEGASFPMQSQAGQSNLCALFCMWNLFPHRGDICEYGKRCTKAHSVEELQEWIQRAKAAERNRKSAKRDGLLSYQDRLVAEYKECRNEVFIVRPHLLGGHWLWGTWMIRLIGRVLSLLKAES